MILSVLLLARFLKDCCSSFFFFQVRGGGGRGRTPAERYKGLICVSVWVIGSAFFLYM